MGWRKTKVTLESEFCFGKHQGKNIKWLIDNDIQYVTWAIGKGVIGFDYKRRPDDALIAETYYKEKLKTS